MLYLRHNLVMEIDFYTERLVLPLRIRISVSSGDIDVMPNTVASGTPQLNLNAAAQPYGATIAVGPRERTASNIVGILL